MPREMDDEGRVARVTAGAAFYYGNDWILEDNGCATTLQQLNTDLNSPPLNGKSSSFACHSQNGILTASRLLFDESCG
jgi:hypothetical protein